MNDRLSLALLVCGCTGVFLGAAAVIAPFLGVPLVRTTVPVAAVGVVTALLVLAALVLVGSGRHRSGLSADGTQTVERAPLLGQELGAAIERGDRAAVGRRLESVAGATLRARTRATADRSRDLLRTGGWTDDPVAACTIAGYDRGSGPITQRLYEALFPRRGLRRRVRRTIAAIERIGGNEAERSTHRAGTTDGQDSNAWQIGRPSHGPRSSGDRGQTDRRVDGLPSDGTAGSDRRHDDDSTPGDADDCPATGDAGPVTGGDGSGRPTADGGDRRA